MDFLLKPKKKNCFYQFFRSTWWRYDDDFSYDWINLVVYAIGQNSFVEPDKEEEERLQVEYDKDINISYYLFFNWQKQDAITNKMDSSEYVDYTECRRVSFRKS